MSHPFFPSFLFFNIASLPFPTSFLPFFLLITFISSFLLLPFFLTNVSLHYFSLLLYLHSLSFPPSFIQVFFLSALISFHPLMLRTSLPFLILSLFSFPSIFLRFLTSFPSTSLPFLFPFFVFPSSYFPPFPYIFSSYFMRHSLFRFFFSFLCFSFTATSISIHHFLLPFSTSSLLPFLPFLSSSFLP